MSNPQPPAPKEHVTGVDTWHSPVGQLCWSVNDLGLDRLWFNDCPPARWVHQTLQPRPARAINLIRTQLEAYFAGELKAFDIPLAPYGTDFQRDAWNVLQTIEYGQTLSYSEQAASMGRPTATRAVANANGANPIPIIIPCHRVIASDGSLGGYGPGIPLKQWLLQHEQKHR